MPTVRTAKPRDDGETLRDAVGVGETKSNSLQIKDISAGEQEFKIWQLMYEEYKRTGNPIPADRSAQIVREVAGEIQNPHANLNAMTKKGLLQKVDAPTNCPRIPLSQGIRIWTGTRSNRVQVWPKEQAQPTQVAPVPEAFTSYSREEVVEVSSPRVRTKEELEEQVRQIEQTSRERMHSLFQQRVQEYQLLIDEQAANVERLKIELEQVQENLRNSRMSLEVITRNGPASDLDQDTQKRIASLRALIDNYELLFA